MEEGFDFEESLEEQQPISQILAQGSGQQPLGFPTQQQPTLFQQNQQQQQQPVLQLAAHQQHFQPQQQPSGDSLALQQDQQQQQQQILHQQQQSQQQPITAYPVGPGMHNALDVRRQQAFRPPEKKTVCAYWLKGTCHRGENCGFLHQLDPSRTPLCPDLKKYGACTTPECPFKHDKDDMKDCNMYRLGFCVYGPNCRYRHTSLPGPPPPPETVEAARPRPQHRFGQDFNSFGRGRGRFQPYTGPGRGIRPFQVRPPGENGVQMISGLQDPQSVPVQ